MRYPLRRSVKMIHFLWNAFYFAWYINIFNQFLGERGGFFFNRLQVQRPVYTTIQKNTHHVNKNVWKFLDQCCNRCEFLVFQKGKYVNSYLICTSSLFYLLRIYCSYLYMYCYQLDPWWRTKDDRCYTTKVLSTTNLSFWTKIRLR